MLFPILSKRVEKSLVIYSWNSTKQPTDVDRSSLKEQTSLAD